MASLKDLKNRIKSVKSTQKITKAMKMVAAAKLKRAQEHAEMARPYAEKMTQVVGALAASVGQSESAPLLLRGTGREQKQLLVVMTSDRGLCGGFNSTIVRAAKRRAIELRAEGKEALIYTVGRKGYEQLKPEFRPVILGTMNDVTKQKATFALAQDIFGEIQKLVAANDIDVVTLVYNRFRSAISQVVTFNQIMPLAIEASAAPVADSGAQYEYEPGEEKILDDLLPRNIAVQIYRALLENAASEQGARMTAMDNATRNAGEMINKLTLVYNRTRQAAITTELTEIISGAEAV